MDLCLQKNKPKIFCETKRFPIFVKPKGFILLILNKQIMTTAIIDKKAKTAKIIYWIFTILFLLPECLGTLLFFNNKMAIEGTHHLGFPEYFRIELSIGKILGGILLIIPMVPTRIKEWIYVGFGISVISAFIANWSVDGLVKALGVLPVLAILIVSYIYYHKLKQFGNK